MIETEYRLEEFRQATIDSSGVGSAIGIGPTRPGERWEITNTSVTADAACTFQSFRGRELHDSRQIDYTQQGQGDSSDTVIKLAPQEVISCKWTGTAGVIGTVVFTGSRYVPGRRAY